MISSFLGPLKFAEFFDTPILRDHESEGVRQLPGFLKSQSCFSDYE